jgi:hypothetical protein
VMSDSPELVQLPSPSPANKVEVHASKRTARDGPDNFWNM